MTETGIIVREPLTPDFRRNPYVFRCPKPRCYTAVSRSTEADIIKVRDEHQCPNPGGTTTRVWPVGVVISMWEELDRLMDEFMGLEPCERKTELKGQLRGMAWGIAIMSSPHYRTVADVSREAANRYKARQSGDAEYRTPGIDFFLPPPAQKTEGYPFSQPDGKPWSEGHVLAGVPTSPSKVKARTPSQPNRGKIVSVDEQAKAGIKAALSSGLFTAEQLAPTYGVTVEYIKSLA